MHFISLCLIASYATKRTMIIEAERWNYHKGERRNMFLPLSETCTEADESDRRPWPGTHETRVIDLEFVNGMMKLPGQTFFQLGIPEDLSERINRFSGDPSAWWIGQIIHYLFRYQPKTRKVIDQAKENMNFRQPIVGIHVRRTDKVGKEAAFHYIDEYMSHAEEFFEKLELHRKVNTRRIYLASEDPSVLSDARKRYLCNQSNMYFNN